MLHILCYFIVKSQIPTPDKDSNLKMLEFSDNDMERLFEKFVLNYYCQDEFKDLKARAETMDWDIEPDIEGENEPEWVDWWNKKMKTDIFLTLGDRTLIIDTKLNTKPLEENQFGELRFKTGYLYQLNSYVLNEDRNNPGKVDGMLLHAKTSLQTEEPYYQGHKPNGNKMMVRCLDLMQDWEGISAQLNSFLKY